MYRYDKIIRDSVFASMQALSFQCVRCTKSEECEDHNGTCRYCDPLIEAAILGESTFEIPFKSGD